MKRLFYLIMLLVAAGCSGTAKEEAKADAVLNVKVNDAVSDEVVVVCHNDIQTLKLDEQGCASYVLENEEAAYFRLYHGREALLLYAEKGDVAVLEFKGGDMLRSYSFDGDKEEAVKYLNSVKLIPLPDEDYALEFEQYRDKLAKNEKDALRLLRARDLSAAGNFAAVEEQRIKYAYGAALIMHPVGHMIMSGNMGYVPDQSYYDVIAEYVVEDPSLIAIDEYRMFVAEAMHLLDEDNRGLTEIYPKTVAQLKYAADNLMDEKVRESVIHHIATAYVDNFGVKDIVELENLHHTYVKSEKMIESYQAKCERWDLSRPGRMSPGLRATDVDGKEYTLADFRGKYVYIDMWATWCGPCKREMPYLKALEEEFKDAEIVFLGLSVDKDKAAWEEMVRTGDLTGVQLYLGTGSSFQEAYRVEGIPRFILLDKSGRIISNDMSRPSSEETAETLRNLEGIR